MRLVCRGPIIRSVTTAVGSTLFKIVGQSANEPKPFIGVNSVTKRTTIVQTRKQYICMECRIRMGDGVYTSGLHCLQNTALRFPHKIPLNRYARDDPNALQAAGGNCKHFSCTFILAACLTCTYISIRVTWVKIVNQRKSLPDVTLNRGTMS